MFPFLVKGRMDDDSKTLEMANVGPGSYSPSNVNLNQVSSQALRLKQNLSIGSNNAMNSYLDASSNKVINLEGVAKIACFGSSQGRFDE